MSVNYYAAVRGNVKSWMKTANMTEYKGGLCVDHRPEAVSSMAASILRLFSDLQRTNDGPIPKDSLARHPRPRPRKIRKAAAAANMNRAKILMTARRKPSPAAEVSARIEAAGDDDEMVKGTIWKSAVLGNVPDGFFPIPLQQWAYPHGFRKANVRGWKVPMSGWIDMHSCRPCGHPTARDGPVCGQCRELIMHAVGKIAENVKFLMQK
jgi:hypothetical protein